MEDFKYTHLIKDLLDNPNLNVDKQIIINEWEIFCEKIVNLLSADTKTNDIKK